MTTQELKDKLAALESERDEIEAWIKRNEEESKQKQYRLVELTGRGGWRSQVGEIQETQRAISDSEFPILETNGETGYRNRTLRVIKVTAKTTSIRADGSDRIFRYQRNNGILLNSKYDYDKIDAAKALSLWEEHEKSKV